MSFKLKEESDVSLLIPRLYRVILLNDDYTTFDFVIEILKTVFNKSEEEAINLTLKVDREGSAVVGVYPYEIAEIKVNRVHTLARNAGFPLRARIEEE
ncbi:ATP-dependent Clp protease adaptor ClpS [Caminibacter sp.]